MLINVNVLVQVLPLHSFIYSISCLVKYTIMYHCFCVKRITLCNCLCSSSPLSSSSRFSASLIQNIGEFRANCEIFNDTCFEKHLHTTASENNKKIFRKIASYNDHYMINMGGQRSSISSNWLLTGPYSQRCMTAILSFNELISRLAIKALEQRSWMLM